MEDNQTSVIGTLLERMDSSPGFAGLGASVQTITNLADADDGETRGIADAILRDAALTSRLLRIANSSRHAHGGRNVTTIDQAIAILGLKTVKSVALSLALLDALSTKPQSEMLKAEIVAAYFCGALASTITRQKAPRFNAQEAQVCGLMQNLGRMMVLYYLYQEIDHIRAVQAEKNCTEEEAAAEVLGASFEEIGAAVAQHWNLPDTLQQSLAPMGGKVPRVVPASPLAWNQVCTLFARLITDAVFRLAEDRAKIEIARYAELFRDAMTLRESEVHEWIERELEETGALLAEMSFPCDVEHARGRLRKASERVLNVLSAQDVLKKDSNELTGKTPVEIVQHVLRLVHTGFGFDRTLLCLPDGASGLRAIAGVGHNINQITPRFRLQGAQPDVFRLVMGKKADLFVADVHSPSLAKVMPAWYDSLVGASSFLLLSLVNDGKFLGLLYGDYNEGRPAAPMEAVQDKLKAWREQLARALSSRAQPH